MREADLVPFLQKYTFEQFTQDVANWLVSGTTVWFIHGNFLDTEALHIVNLVRNGLNLKPVGLGEIY